MIIATRLSAFLSVQMTLGNDVPDLPLGTGKELDSAGTVSGDDVPPSVSDNLS